MRDQLLLVLPPRARECPLPTGQAAAGVENVRSASYLLKLRGPTFGGIPRTRGRDFEGVPDWPLTWVDELQHDAADVHVALHAKGLLHLQVGDVDPQVPGIVSDVNHGSAASASWTLQNNNTRTTRTEDGPDGLGLSVKISGRALGT